MKRSNNALFTASEKCPVCETIQGRHDEIDRLTREYLASGGGISYCRPHLPRDLGNQTITPKSRLGIPYMEAGDRTGLPVKLLGDLSGDDRDENTPESPLISQGSLGMSEEEDYV